MEREGWMASGVHTALERYGMDVLGTERWGNILSDLFPNGGWEKRVLDAAAELGLVKKAQMMLRSGAAPESVQRKTAEELREACGISVQCGRKAMGAVCAALGYPVHPADPFPEEWRQERERLEKLSGAVREQLSRIAERKTGGWLGLLLRAGALALIFSVSVQYWRKNPILPRGWLESLIHWNPVLHPKDWHRIAGGCWMAAAGLFALAQISPLCRAAGLYRKRGILRKRYRKIRGWILSGNRLYQKKIKCRRGRFRKWEEKRLRAQKTRFLNRTGKLRNQPEISIEGRLTGRVDEALLMILCIGTVLLYGLG